MTLAINIFAFLIAVSVIVSFHEFGHFWVARRLGVKVLRYSIGFGKALWSRSGKDGTEYVIAAIPLGGYVKMLDEREAPVAAGELDRAFNRQSLSARTAIVAAGPLFNFILALILFYFMFVVGVVGIKPIVAGALPGSVAEKAGVLSGDQFLEVAGKDVRSWQQVQLAMLDASFRQPEFAAKVAREETEAVVLVFDASKMNLMENVSLLDQFGILPRHLDPDTVIGEVVSGAGADRASLREGDRLVSLAGEEIRNWSSLVKAVTAVPGQDVVIGVVRQGDYFETVVTIDEVERGGKTIGRMGVLPQRPSPEVIDGHQLIVNYGVFESFGLAAGRTWEMTLLTLRIMWKLLIGEAALENISGPVGIAEYAGMSLMQGLGAFLGLLALLSISIGILNLLPVPMLDGGHLLYYLIEFIKGSPVSEQGQIFGQWIGFFLLGCLLLLALYNDIGRLLG